ncbi:DUF6655 family protein [Singulisphaera sp. PoT]|uniref:DUF6655 family protein n=1 Tax=Singulisphaera sp. PoT TaxID=3411797 RepID=UPI003BF55D96
MATQRRWPRPQNGSVLALALLSAVGCGTVKTTGTTRSGTEQLLLTHAWDNALQKVDFRPLTGVPVYLDTTNVTSVDQGWVVSSIRQAMLSQGVLLRAKPEQAQWVVEARVGAYGTNDKSWLLGISQTTIPPTVTGIPSGTIPELPLIKRSDQQAVAKLALFAYDRASGQFMWNSGTMLATASSKDVFIGGLGPIHKDSISGGAEFVGVRLPVPGQSSSSEYDTPAANQKQASDPTAIRQSPAGDSDSFAP